MPKPTAPIDSRAATVADARASAEHCHDELANATALLRVIATALDGKDDVEDEAAAVMQAVERVEAVRRELDGAELRHWARDGLQAGKTLLEAYHAATGASAREVAA